MTYKIQILRGQSNGRLKFQSGGVNVNTLCWWDSKLVVDAGTYTGYATHMANKKDSVTKDKRPGIWFGKDVPCNNGKRKSNAIFVHEGKNAGWSDGCVVADRADVIKIWDAISPKEKANVTIEISDES